MAVIAAFSMGGLTAQVCWGPTPGMHPVSTESAIIRWNWCIFIMVVMTTSTINTDTASPSPSAYAIYVSLSAWYSKISNTRYAHGLWQNVNVMKIFKSHLVKHDMRHCICNISTPHQKHVWFIATTIAHVSNLTVIPCDLAEPMSLSPTKPYKNYCVAL